MTDSEKPEGNDRRDYWRQLAAELGAPVPDEPEEVDDVSEAGDERSTPAGPGVMMPRKDEATTERRPPPRPPSDWHALCSQLGVEAPPESPVEPAAAPTEEPVESPSEDALPMDAEAIEVHDHVSEISFFEPDTALEIDVADVEVDEEIDEDLESDEELTSSATGVAEIADEEDTIPEEDDGERKLPPRRRRRGRRRAETPSVDEVELESSAGDLSELDVGEQLVAPEEEASGEEEEETGGVEQKKAAPRGRRPRRRSARREEATVAGEDQSELRDQDAGASGDDATATDGASEPKEADKRVAPGATKSKHRKIPTWEEAVAVLVSSNLESRSRSGNAKGKSRGSRRRGRGSGDRR
jgi:hypothetical protein